jgi:hypothetical protein
MTHSPFGPDYPGSGYQAGAYRAVPGAYGGSEFSGDDRGPGTARYLSAAAVALGAAVYCVGFGPMADQGGPGWEVRFSVLAALVSALTFLPRRAPQPWIVVALAAAGFLDAVAGWIGAQQVGWALVVVVALTGLQTVVAVATAIVTSGGDGEGDDAVAPGYAAYPYYAAYAAYAAQVQQAAPAPRQQPAQATARGSADGHAHAHQSYEAIRARYAEYTDTGRSTGARESGAAPTTSAGDAGIVSAGRGAAPAHETTEVIREQRPSH